jgi:putative peptidoglycan lipid II flippase
MSRGGLLRSTAVFSAMTFLSRIAGLARDLLQATLFGTGAAVSAFVVAYRIPNYLRRIFAEGSFSSAFVPVLSELHERGDRAALQDFLDHVAGALLATVAVITGLGMLFAPWIARLFLLFAGKDSEQVALTAEMLRITFPYLAFISMTALAGAILNSVRRFGLPAFTPVLHNLAVIAAMLGLARYFEVPEYALAWGVFLAGLAQWALLWPALGRLGLRPRLKVNLRHEGVRRVFGLMLPTIFSSSVSQLNLLVGTMFASMLVSNAQAWLYYSDRLVEFPLGLFGVAIGTVILPHLSRRHAATDAAGYSHALDWGLRLVALVSIPAALGLALMAAPLCATLFQYGEFTANDTTMVAVAVVAMSVGVPAFMLSKVLLPAFYARQDTRTPMRAAVITVLANVVLTAVLVLALRWAGMVAPHGGIALATSLAGVLNAVLLWRYLMRQGAYRAEKGWLRLFAQILFGATLMVVVVAWARMQLGDWAELGDWYLRLGWLLLVVGAGALAYGLGLLIAGVRPRHLREA